MHPICSCIAPRAKQSKNCSRLIPIVRRRPLLTLVEIDIYACDWPSQFTVVAATTVISLSNKDVASLSLRF